ncbi:MAG TPA: HAMP domain-containing sensor histidine kinase [Solirubrobacteraceae bacterium]|jgi:two-component system sensor histidine kinase MprB
MSLRVRIAAVASVAVALAVLAAAIGLYLAVRSDLRGQIDQSLRQRAKLLVSIPPTAQPGAKAPGAATLTPPPVFFGTVPSRGGRVPSAIAAYRLRNGLPRAIQPARFGGASGYVQFISSRAKIEIPAGQGTSPAIGPSAADKAIARRGSGQVISDRTVKGTHLRVLTSGIGGRGAVLIARPLGEVDHELGRILLILLVVGVLGILIAAGLGALVARTALAPIARFTRRTETLAGDLDLSQRLEVEGRDELARLAGSFNATLDALEHSVEARRHLVADAGHELRTPLASLRANIQTLEDSHRLTPADQEALRRDILDELDELTALVSDVVELARGVRGEGTPDDVSLDEIVREAVERTRRRGELRFQLELEPTIIRGEPDRVSRAVSNVLENARKWSPPGALVEVALHDGVLTVRDHGPGFARGDLPNVFERFYRAEEARKLPGSGLGLAIVRQAAEAHSGYAEAGNAPGGGACLRVSFGPPLRLPDEATLHVW